METRKHPTPRLELVVSEVERRYKRKFDTDFDRDRLRETVEKALQGDTRGVSTFLLLQLWDIGVL